MLPLNHAEIKLLSPVPVTRVAFGLRYMPQYRIMDRAGSVVDSILRSDGTPFSPEVFPASISNADERALIDPESGKSLRVTHTDTILQLPLETRNLEDLRSIGEDFDRFALRPLAHVAEVTGIARYGMLVTFGDVTTQIKKRPTVRYLGTEFPNANSLAMRFTQRFPADEALARKDVEDYRNAIYSLKEEIDGTVALSIDYQEYFKPELSRKEWDARPFSKFVNRAISYFRGDFRRWFSTITEAAEVA